MHLGSQRYAKVFGSVFTYVLLLLFVFRISKHDVTCGIKKVRGDARFIGHEREFSKLGDERRFLRQFVAGGRSGQTERDVRIDDAVDDFAWKQHHIDAERHGKQREVHIRRMPLI